MDAQFWLDGDAPTDSGLGPASDHGDDAPARHLTSAAAFAKKGKLMTLRLIGVCVGLSVAPCVLMGQGSKVDLKAEETAIRALIEKGIGVPYTEDSITWSGATKRPAVGPQRGEPFPEAKVDKRKNQKTVWKVERLEVAASGDMAWEFSYGKLEYDLDESPSRHVSFDTAALRIWKNMGGQWKVAASFQRPLDQPFASR
jgi:ketosteroid isomerase-like protein